jgi:hypothetical protein
MSTPTDDAGVKAGRKVAAAAAAGRQEDYETTRYGRTRRSRVPKFLMRLVALLCSPFPFLCGLRLRLRERLGVAGRPDPQTAAGHKAAGVDGRARSAADGPATPHA